MQDENNSIHQSHQPGSAAILSNGLSNGQSNGISAGTNATRKSQYDPQQPQLAYREQHAMLTPYQETSAG